MSPGKRKLKEGTFPNINKIIPKSAIIIPIMINVFEIELISHIFNINNQKRDELSPSSRFE